MTPTWPRNVHVAAALSTPVPKVVLTCPPSSTAPLPHLAAVCLIWAVDHLAGDVDTAPVVFYGQAIVSSISYAIKFKYTCDKNQILLDI